MNNRQIALLAAGACYGGVTAVGSRGDVIISTAAKFLAWLDAEEPADG